MNNAPQILKGSFECGVISGEFITRPDRWIETEFVFMRFRDICVMGSLSRHDLYLSGTEQRPGISKLKGGVLHLSPEGPRGFMRRATKKRIKGFIRALISGTLEDIVSSDGPGGTLTRNAPGEEAHSNYLSMYSFIDTIEINRALEALAG